MEVLINKYGLLLRWIFVCGSMALYSNAIAQDPLRDGIYTSDLDSLWSKNMYIQHLSSDGKWVTVKEVYDQKEPHFLLINSENDSVVELNNLFSHRFSSDGKWLAYITSNFNFKLLKLEGSLQKTFTDVKSFEFDDASQNIAIRFYEPESSLIVMDLEDFAETKFDKVSDYKWRPYQSEILIYKNKDNFGEVLLYNCKSGLDKVLMKGENSQFPFIKYSSNGNAVVLLEQQNDYFSVKHYSFKSDKTTILNDVSLGLPGFSISGRDIMVSDNGAQVFFFREDKTNQNSEKEGLNVWKTSDPWIYPWMQKYQNNELKYFLTFWDVSSGKLTEITDNNTPTYQLNPNHCHGLVSDKAKYEPQYKQFQDVDVYLKDYKSGEKKLIISKQYNEQGFISISPKGRYIAYFRKGHWWCFDSKNSMTINLTNDLNISFKNEYLTGAADLAPHGSPGWSEDEKHILLYDEFDVWLVDSNGRKKQKITAGRESGKTYRISRDAQRNEPEYLKLLQSQSGIGYNLTNGLLLELKNSQFKTGYALWNERSGFKEIYYDDYISESVLLNNDKIIFARSWFDTPPAIYSLKLGANKVNKLYQSNPELLNYDFGKAEFFKYSISETDSLQGLLFYPAHFKFDKKYPMIVKPYERVIAFDVGFDSPSDYKFGGFSLLRFLTNDYFVFIPTIRYEMQKPGGSAVNSVMSAIDHIIENYPVDKDRIGLIGHSFGGYQTAFTVTQTDRFAAAVAGAAVTDLVNFYHDVSWDWHMDQMWRIENQQYRMGGSYYNMKKEYSNNSAMQFVEQLNTPLLLWTGREDNNVNWTQSLNMFMAMKRLCKEGELILFEEEPHYLIKKQNQKNLSVSILNWFDKYLKKEWSN